MPMTDITSISVCNALISTWIARFGPPLTLPQIEVHNFAAMTQQLNEILGIHHIWKTPFNPKANGMIERAHRSLKASLKARGKHWITQLPFILLGFRMRPDGDMTSAFSRVTGEQPLVPHILPPSINFTQLAI